MPTIYSHSNKSVSKIWFLILGFCIFAWLISYKTILLVKEIEKNTDILAQQLGE